ncbi:MAG: hypothetical protein ACR2N2_07000 [Acidimicrobiia bacterium]
MTSAHPPVPAQSGFRHDHDWLWLGLSAIGVAIVAYGIMWAVVRPFETSTAALPAETVGFEYSTEATPLHMPVAGVTGEYYGLSGELFPAITVLPAASGFDYDHEVTSIHLPIAGVTGHYFGNSGELYPAITVLPAASGFDYDHEVTPGHKGMPGVTGYYFGNSGELFADR